LYDPTKNIPTGYPDRDRKKKARIKSKKGIAALVLFSLVTFVSAAVYSNTLTGQFGLTAVYPLDLSFDVDPWNSNCFVDQAQTANLQIENLGDVTIIGDTWFLEITVNGPVGLVPADVVMLIDGDPVALLGTTDLSATVPMLSGVPALSSISLPFSWTFQITAIIGVYDISIYAGIP
jgi:hypothetical protein